MSLTAEVSAWFRCKDCQAVFKLKQLMVRHLKAKHNHPDRPEWELDHNDSKCRDWWERVRVEGSTVIPIELKEGPPPPQSFSFASSTISSPSALLKETAKNFRCELCPNELYFAFKKSLYAHLLKNHDRGLCKTPGLHLCRFCGAQASTPSTLKAHIRTHLGENNGGDSRLVECSASCGQFFSSAASMKKHVRFKCSEAKELFENAELELPSKRNPGVSRQSSTDHPFKCTLCVETFPTMARLNGHGSVHNGDAYRCRYCGAPFAHVHTRGAHETNAHNDQVGFGYRCPICAKKFGNLATIRGHYKYTHWLDLPTREEIEGWRINEADAGEMMLPHPVQHIEIGPDDDDDEQGDNDLKELKEGDGVEGLGVEQYQIHEIVGMDVGGMDSPITFSILSQQTHSQQLQQPTHPHTQPETDYIVQGPLYSSRGPLGIPMTQVTMGALIGHIPSGETMHQFDNVTGSACARKSQPPDQSQGQSNDGSNSKGKKGKGSKRKRKEKPKLPPKLERKKFHCRKSGCEEKFQRRWELTWHLERVHGEFQCEFCNLLPPFRTKPELVVHGFQCHHRELGCYECRLCGKGLESPRGVQEHVALEHPGTPVPLTLEAKMWRRGAIPRKRVHPPPSHSQTETETCM